MSKTECLKQSVQLGSADVGVLWISSEVLSEKRGSRGGGKRGEGNAEIHDIKYVCRENTQPS